ncbi:hypothetical protein [Collinsella sp. Sow4_E3]|uniref:hypothetical protein n=1 Tax=Collinsella sp. Sow4_E3 TaxID=3438776 RepID=UPI003F91ADA2
MKRTVNKISDELALQIVKEYLSTDISQSELKKKYNFGGNNNISRWMRKFGVSKPSSEQQVITGAMSKEQTASPRERDLERKIRKLEDELKEERLKSLALNTLIDVAERDLQVDIRKKSGAKR